MRPGFGARSKAGNRRRIGQWTVPQPAIYEVRAIGVKLSARQNRRRWRLGAVNPSGFHPETVDRPAVYAKRCFIEADEGDLGCPVQSPVKKFSVSRLTQISRISIAVPPLRGAFRDRHGREAGCGGRGGRF